MKHLQFSCSLWDEATALPDFWEHTIGSGHAPLALRGDWQQQLQECRKQLGFRHTRFHGLLCDEMGTLMDEKNELLYSFFNADQICNCLLSIGMKPFVELSSMPTTLATGARPSSTTAPTSRRPFRAFELLHRLGNEALPVSGAHDTVDVWAVRGSETVTVLLTNHVLPRHAINSESIRIKLTGMVSPRDVYIERIDDDHGNAKKLWIEIGSPALPKPRDVEQMRVASQIVREPLIWRHEGDTLHLDVTMPAHAIAAITVELTQRRPGASG